MTPEKSLRGCHILVIEDEYLLAEEIQAGLSDLGAEVVGPASSVAQGAAFIRNAERIDGAILDVNLAGEMVYPAADMLMERGIPFIFSTGYDAGIIPAAYSRIVRCEKPLDVGTLTNALRQQVHGEKV